LTKKFSKQYDKADSSIKTAVDRRLHLFMRDPFHPQLNNHALTGNYTGYRSVNITGDWRAIYSENISEDTVIFELLGTHSSLYR